MFSSNTDSKRAKVDENLVACLGMLILSVVVCCKSSLNPYFPVYPTTDSAVYLYIAKVMRTGGVMYRDVFDHKGPLLYIINFLGTLINVNRGVWLIEYLSVFLTSFFSYRIIRKFCTPALSIIGAVCAMLLLNPDFIVGNDPEEYSLPFITGSLLIFIEYFIVGEVSRIKLLLCGFSWMAVMLIRPNMIGCWIVFSIAVLIKEICDKTYRILRFLGFFLLGAVILLVPIIIYLFSVGALGDFWNQYILFNLNYSGANTTNRLETLRLFFTLTPILLSMCVSLVCACYDQAIREIAIIEFFYIIVNVCLTGMSGRSYVHYGISLMPLYILPVAFIVQALYKATERHVLLTILVVVLIPVLLIPWILSIKELSEKPPIEYSVEYAISVIIEQNTQPNDTIISCGNRDQFYLLSDRMSASKYSYQYPIGDIKPSIYDELMEDLYRNDPKVIITCSNELNGTPEELKKRIDPFIETNGYSKWFDFEIYSVYGKKSLKSKEYKVD